MNYKKVLLEIARWTVVCIAVFQLVTMFRSDVISTAQAQDVCAEVTAVMDMTVMTEGDNQMIKRLYGLDPIQYESCILYYPSTNMMAEELLIVKLKDVAQQESVRAAAQSRLATQKNTFEGYGVEQFDLLTNYSVIDIRGNFVMFVVSKHFTQAQTAFADAL